MPRKSQATSIVSEPSDIDLKRYRATFLGKDAGIGLIESPESPYILLEFLVGDDGLWKRVPWGNTHSSRYLRDINECFAAAHAWMLNNCDRHGEDGAWAFRSAADINELRKWISCRANTESSFKWPCGVGFLEALESTTLAAVDEGIDPKIIIDAIESAARTWRPSAANKSDYDAGYREGVAAAAETLTACADAHLAKTVSASLDVPGNNDRQKAS